MSVDFEAIAQRGRCDVSSLRLAQPLLEQGYTPPFLAKYRRDELGGIDEASLWALAREMATAEDVNRRRESLRKVWESTPLTDPALGRAIEKASSLRMLARLSKRLKSESSSQSDSDRLAVRVLNPRKGDGDDLNELASGIEGITDASAAVAGLDAALAKRISGDPRVVGAAVRWLTRQAKISIGKVADIHTDEAKQAAADPPAPVTQTPPPADAVATSPPADPKSSELPQPQPTEASTAQTGTAEATNPTPVVSSTAAAVETAPTTAAAPTASGSPAEPAATSPDTNPPASESSPPAGSSPDAVDSSPETAGSSPEAAGSSSDDEGAVAADSSKSAKAAPAQVKPKRPKKISPRQRRRKWLVAVLKPLQNKKFTADKLSAFQLVMLSRALRSQVAQCGFQYDAAKLVSELQRSVLNLNRHLQDKLAEIVLTNEAAIRDAAESAWWDDLVERASTRLVGITAEHLQSHIARGGVDAAVVMAIDAVGPRTAAACIVAADGRVLACEDIPCQLGGPARAQAVTRLGELVHAHHIDLIVISNGPARRGTMVAVSDLIAQSPEGSVRWTLADRGGADAYAGSNVADQEMRSTPRRFRSAAWVAFSVLRPAQAIAKVDPLKLRLNSFQRELSDDALNVALRDVIVSGASRGGVDVNSAPATWLAKLPGVDDRAAEAIDAARREKLFDSRSRITELDVWSSAAAAKQALAFLRVFGSEETLDGTLIHPDDYPLAKKLAKALEIELPPEQPPGYRPPDYSAAQPDPAEIVEKPPQAEPLPVEEFTAKGESAPEFQVETAETQTGETQTGETETGETQTGETQTGETEPAASETESPVQPAAAAESPEPDAAVTADLPAEADSSADNASERDSSAGDELAAKSTADDFQPPAPFRRPRPEPSKVGKCVKEWQIGRRRADQIVRWLCDPFGDSDPSGESNAVMNRMPTLATLKPGDEVIGVVVGVMPFGVFVELAPDCSGLIHISRLSDVYIDDLHEVVQVGDVITAWVTGTDDKRRRVALSAISPTRQAELEEQRQRQRERRGDRGKRPQQSNSPKRSGGGGPSRPTSQPSAGAGQTAPTGKSGRGGQGRGGDRPPRGGRGERSRDGRGRDSRSRDGGRGNRRPRQPESYRVVGKKEEKPLTDAMQKGEEPLRSFGDLAQFLGKPKGDEPQPPPAPESSSEGVKSSPEVEVVKSPPEVVESPPEVGQSPPGANKPDVTPEQPPRQVREDAAEPDIQSPPAIVSDKPESGNGTEPSTTSPPDSAADASAR